jgi:hypothetical protein
MRPPSQVISFPLVMADRLLAYLPRCYEATCWGKLLLFLVAFYTLVPLAANYTGWPFSLLHQTAYEQAIHGPLPQLWPNRGAATYYLNGNNLVAYDFMDFGPAHAPLAHVVLTPAERAVVAERGAGPFLREGHYLTKAAQDSVLAVRRGALTMYWVCPLPPPTSR